MNIEYKHFKRFLKLRVFYSFNFNHQLLKILFYFESNLIYIDCILNIFISIYKKETTFILLILILFLYSEFHGKKDYLSFPAQSSMSDQCFSYLRNSSIRSGLCRLRLASSSTVQMSAGRTVTCSSSRRSKLTPRFIKLKQSAVAFIASPPICPESRHFSGFYLFWRF